VIFRVSNVEAFRQWREDEEAELEPLLARLRGQDEPSDAMKAGTAFHLALETAQEGESRVLSAPGYRFNIDCDITLALPEVREIRAHRDYGPIRITGKVDAIEGRRVEDHKTTARFEPEWYLPGYQWRFYLDIFGGDVFRWNVFEMDFDDIDTTTGDSVYTVRGFHVLEQTRYPALHEDCARLAADLHLFASEHMPELRRAA
jgi:hypothetical protein